MFNLLSKVLLVFIVCLCFNTLSIKANDTIFKVNEIVQEEIIYEYDTLFLPPDTINIADTIINKRATKNKPIVKEKTNTKNKKVNINFLRGLKGKNFVLGIDFGVFNSVAYKNVSNFHTLPKSQPINIRFGINLSYNRKLWNYTLGFDYLRMSENHNFKSQYTYTDTVIINGIYEISDKNIVNTASVTNYFSFLGTYVGVSRYIYIKNFVIQPATRFTLYNNFFTNQKTVTTQFNVENITSSQTSGKHINAEIALAFGLKNNNSIIQICPYYNYSFQKNNLYPLTLRNNLGIRVHFLKSIKF